MGAFIFGPLLELLVTLGDTVPEIGTWNCTAEIGERFVTVHAVLVCIAIRTHVSSTAFKNIHFWYPLVPLLLLNLRWTTADTKPTRRGQIQLATKLHQFWNLKQHKEFSSGLQYLFCPDPVLFNFRAHIVPGVLYTVLRKLIELVIL